MSAIKTPTLYALQDAKGRIEPWSVRPTAAEVRRAAEAWSWLLPDAYFSEWTDIKAAGFSVIKVRVSPVKATRGA